MMRVLRAVLSCGLAAMLAVAMPVSAVEVAATDILDCNPAMYRFFPGEYNACLGRNFMQKQQYERGRKMLELAASWGNKHAQSALGVMYFNGEGVPRDHAMGLAWLALAAERGDELPLGLHFSAWTQTSQEDRERSDLLLSGPLAIYRDDVAAVRADRRYRRALAAMRSNSVYGVGTCISGINQVAGADPVQQEAAGEMAGSCSLTSEQAVVRTLERNYQRYFANWRGQVTVGPLESTP